MKLTLLLFLGFTIFLLGCKPKYSTIDGAWRVFYVEIDGEEILNPPDNRMQISQSMSFSNEICRVPYRDRELIRANYNYLSIDSLVIINSNLPEYDDEFKINLYDDGDFDLILVSDRIKIYAKKFGL